MCMVLECIYVYGFWRRGILSYISMTSLVYTEFYHDFFTNLSGRFTSDDTFISFTVKKYCVRLQGVDFTLSQEGVVIKSNWGNGEI